MSFNPNPFNCDICSEPKKETNHWFLGLLANTEPTIQGFQVVLWHDKLAKLKGVAHICGLECAAKWTIKQLSTIA
jgi:hypothetical protein